MDFDRLLGNGNDKDIIDLLIFINRYYEGVDFEDFMEDQKVIEQLKKEEIKRIWIAFDHLMVKVQRVQSHFKERSNLTGKAIE